MELEASGEVETAPQAASLRLEDTALRHKIREYAKHQRKDLRTNATDALRFGLGQIRDEIRELENLSVKDVHGLAGRIKRRKHATTEDMYRLSHAFLQSNDNINAFAATQGAVQVIVKELTGTNVQRQIDAAECLCNLSLGEAHVCEKITTLAGSYLVTYLNSQESRLKRSCLWTLANILASCQKSAKTLLQMQLATKLWKLYTSDVQDYAEDAGICLHLIATHAGSLLPAEDRRYIAEHLHEKQPTQPGGEYYMYIVFQLNLVALESKLCVSKLQHFIEFLSSSELDYNNLKQQLPIVYGVQVLSNIFATLSSSELNQQMDIENLINALNKLFLLGNANLTKDLLQLLRNLMDLNLFNKEQLLGKLRVYDCPISV
ncbi:transmembrane and coiled-coil domain-containing protein 6 [Drosophila albomicans]|uniref:Transmembrane and coiled-coil domain-containing protein 6 n=1 Tax=Drosophila albomicans TaxID=7291 RepID=A0A6P8WLZ9_DROAB|nr:transmembrane and coiled-coil domain-containing protein 6 [Drosophila albomicans]